MKTPMRSMLLLAALLTIGLALPLHALTTTSADARRVAENYVKMIIERDGAWGAHSSAQVLAIEPFMDEDRQLGYFCPVEPVGYLVLGMYRELAPVRLYSCRSNLDPAAEGGLTDFIKVCLGAFYDHLQDKLGHPIDADKDLSHLLFKEFRGTWDALSDPGFDAGAFRRQRDNRTAGMDYQEGQTLLSTTWTQEPPYNDLCPDHGCSWPDQGNYNTNARVGCVATAGAQILKYYNWPPGGAGTPYNDGYDWWYIRESYRWNGSTNQMEVRIDGQWQAATTEEIYAVAQLSRHVGIAVDMDYGCAGSGASTGDLEGAFQGPFKMDDECDVWGDWIHTYSERWEMFKREFNANRPVAYRIPGHAIVADGWRVIDVGGTPTDQVHIVYGWNGSNYGWWSLFEVPGTEWFEDYFVREIYPEHSIHSELAENYASQNAYRYFNRDASGPRADFEAGQRVQVLKSGFLLTNTGTGPGDEIVFHGAPYNDLLIFINGDPMGDQRIKVLDGEVTVLAGGQIAVY